MTKRQVALTNARVAGYHDDTRWFTRLLIESHVNRPAMHEAWRSGAKARRLGVPCLCPDCKEN